MTKELTAIWNILLTTGSYTPAWEKGNEAQSLKDCLDIATGLADLTKKVSCCGTSVEYYWKDNLEFGIYHTYDFANFKSSEEPGFAETSHYTIKLHKGFSISKLTKKDRKALGWN